MGEDFFPSVDSGEFKFHLRAPTGTRIEETAALCDRVENDIRQGNSRPLNSARSSTTSACRTAASNLSYSTSAPIGPGDADIQVELSAEASHATEKYVRALR